MGTKILRLFATSLLLALVLGCIFFVSRSQQAHAAITITTHTNDQPDEYCLSVAQSQAINKITVPVSSPPGTGTKYTFYLRVDNNCSNPVNSIMASANFAGTCPANATKVVPYPVRWQVGTLQGNGGNSTLGIPVTDYCVLDSGGAVPPTSISVDLDASGVFAGGGDAYAPPVVYNV